MAEFDIQFEPEQVLEAEQLNEIVEEIKENSDAITANTTAITNLSNNLDDNVSIIIQDLINTGKIDVDANSISQINVTDIPKSDILPAGKKIEIVLEKGTPTSFNIYNGLDGKAAIISNVTASVNNTTDTPSVTVTTSGTDSNRSFDFAFTGLRGAPGNSITIRDISETSESGGINTVTFSDGSVLNVKNGQDGTTIRAITEAEIDAIFDKVFPN